LIQCEFLAVFEFITYVSLSSTQWADDPRVPHAVRGRRGLFLHPAGS
jgi:hypothetical protein